MIGQSPHYVISTASTRFDDGEKFLTAELARAAEERNDDEGTHGFVANDDGETEAEDGGGDAGDESQLEVEEEAGTASTAAANLGLDDEEVFGT